MEKLKELEAEYNAAKDRRAEYEKMIDALERQFECGEIDESDFAPEHNSMVDTINSMDADVSRIFNQMLLERGDPDDIPF